MVPCLQTFGIHNVSPILMRKGLFHLTNQSFLQFEEQVDFDSPIIVSCYHGVSSRNVATFLVEQGYENVFSVIGGFDGWVKAGLPIETAY